MAEAYGRFRSNSEGRNSDVYPVLASVPSDLFGACVVGTNGNVHAVVDTDYVFPIMSVARDLAVMGATLADGGVNPLTRERIVDATICDHTLAVMTTAGLYEISGDWLYDIGLPAKSGISGGIVTVSPGKGGLGTFAPPLDSTGNSVKGRLVARFLSQALGMDLFVSEPASE
jgi:glutaminase